jgi:outer membrane protein
MRSSLFLFWILVSAPLFSQDKATPWTLQQCIEYALKNNIQVKQNMLNEKTSEAALLQSKAQILPNLSGSGANSYNSGKKVDPFTNQFTSGSFTLSQNFSLSSSVTVFGGFQNLNTIRQNQYNLMASRMDVQKMQNDISLNIASGYLQILLAEELLDVARNQADITKLQVERTKKLVDVGNLPKGNLLDIQSQSASEEVNIVNAENSLSLASLNLVQMLNLDTIENFSITKPEITLPADVVLNTTSGQVYDAALTRQPEIKSAEFKLKSSEKGISIARAGNYPRLSLSGSYGTGYSGASKQIIGDPTLTGSTPYGITSTGDIVYVPTYSYNYEKIPYATQYNNNINKSVGFYLTVPLFNNLQTYTSVARAKIARENAALSLQLQKDNLRKTIQQAYNDALSSLKKYQATQKAVNAMQESFKYMDQKFTVGAATSTEYNDSKNKLIKAKSDLLQSKYDCIFKMKVLDFYQGKPITL